MKYPALLAKLWPEHVKNVTLYGRLISEKYIINVNPDLFHDPIVSEDVSPLDHIASQPFCCLQLGGYVVDIDIRDPGQLFLWLAVGWYFGGTDPKLEPAPLSVGGHMGDHYRESDIIRAFVHGGVELKLELREELVKETPEVPRFGKGKCDHGDTPARWINMEDKPCAPPFCTGNRSDTVNNIDTVRGCDVYCQCMPLDDVQCCLAELLGEESVGVCPSRLLLPFV